MATINKITDGTAQAGSFSAKNDVSAKDDVIAGDDLTVADDAAITGETETGTLQIGGSDELDKALINTVSINPGSIAANTRGTATGTITGAVVGDAVVMNPPATLNAGLAFEGAYISAPDTVTVVLRNTTGSPVDDGALNWTFALLSKVSS